jgi:hypothetical protein
MIAGWGKNSSAQQTMERRLQSALTYEASVKGCAERYVGFDGAHEICVINQAVSAVCEGDSGGPLIASEDGGAVDIGIASYGFGPCSPRLPSVYTRVSGIAGWVQEQEASLSRLAPRPQAFAEFPGVYRTQAAGTTRIGLYVAQDGAHIDGLEITVHLTCQHNQIYDFSAPLDLYQPGWWPIRARVADGDFAFYDSHNRTRGVIVVHARFDELAEAEGTVSVRLLARNRRSGACSVQHLTFGAQAYY